MKIYTKTGDQGETSLLGGTRVQKSHWRLDVYGGFDSLNSVIGIVVANIEVLPALQKSTLQTFLKELRGVQEQLFCFGSHFATEDDQWERLKATLPKLDDTWPKEFEAAMDMMDANIKPLKSFILPGGSVPSSHLHLARTLCREVERRLVDRQSEIPDFQAPLFLQTVVYLNRLSDYLFVGSRFVNHQLGVADEIWTANPR